MMPIQVVAPRDSLSFDYRRYTACYSSSVVQQLIQTDNNSPFVGDVLVRSVDAELNAAPTIPMISFASPVREGLKAHEAQGQPYPCPQVQVQSGNDW